MPHSPNPAPVSAVEEALEACGSNDRLKLWVLLAVGEGLRRGEISRIHYEDIQQEESGWSLVVHGKGAKLRRLPLWQGLALRLREECSPGCEFVFPGGQGGHVSPNWVGLSIARVMPGDWTAHSLRRAFATTLYGATHDILVVQKFLGHSRPETTQGYVLMADDSLRVALATASSVMGKYSMALSGC